MWATDLHAQRRGGQATFDGLSIATVGTGYTFRATSPSLPTEASQASLPSRPPGRGATQLAFSQQPGPRRRWGTAHARRDRAGPRCGRAGGHDLHGGDYGLTLATNPAGGTLSCGPATCTKNAVAGEATFDTLSLGTVGTGYSLLAQSGPLASATSSTFAITPVPAAPTDLTITTFTTGQFLR